MQLTHELAQEIAEKTISIIHKNINIMDETGLIIGTGEKERLYTFHYGALHAVQKGIAIELSPSDSLPQGVKPGINLPIYFKDTILGVVGITGDPAEVRQFGQIVKLHVEMLLQQKHLLERLQEESKAKDYLLLDLVSGHFRTEEDLKLAQAKADILNINLQKPGVLVLLKIVVHSQLECNLLEFEHYKSELNQFFQTTTFQSIIRFYTQLKSDEFLFVMDIEKHTPWAQIKDLLHIQLQKLGKLMPKSPLFCLHFGVGEMVSQTRDYIDSYHAAQFALTIINHRPNQRISFYDSIGLPEVILSIDTTIGNTYLVNTLHQLNQYPKLLESLQTFVEENGNISQAAAVLGVQRMTLMNRLDKIMEMTGKNPRSLADLFELYLALKLKELSRGTLT